MNLIFGLQGLIKGSPLPTTSTSNVTLHRGLDILYEIIGAIVILLLVIAALRYVIAGGDANKVAESKRMIAYTLVGAVVIGLAATIVEFVLSHAT